MNDWLIMVFLGGGNDLTPFAQNLLDEAMRVESSDRVAVVAELHPQLTTEQTLRGRIFKGKNEMRPIGVRNDDVAAIIDFVDDSMEMYKARHRTLVLWDHGNGWQNVDVFEEVVDATEIRRQQLGTTGQSPNLLVKDLRELLDETRDIAVVAFDACLMSMIEVAFQLRDRAQFMVASQHLLPAERGWPYEALLRTMTSNPRMEPEELTRATIDTFSGSYNGSDDAVTLTGLRLSAEVDRAVAAIDSLSAALLEAIHASDHANGTVRDEVIDARLHAQSFGNPEYIDIVSFCDEIRKRLPRLSRSTDLVRTAIARLVVRHTRSSSAIVSRANGVSIYFPNVVPEATIVESYADLDFANPFYCRWAGFLKVIVEGMNVHAVEKMMAAAQKSPILNCDCAKALSQPDPSASPVSAPSPSPQPSRAISAPSPTRSRSPRGARARGGRRSA